MLSAALLAFVRMYTDPFGSDAEGAPDPAVIVGVLASASVAEVRTPSPTAAIILR